jgi:hypothetical protein
MRKIGKAYAVMDEPDKEFDCNEMAMEILLQLYGPNNAYYC